MQLVTQAYFTLSLRTPTGQDFTLVTDDWRALLARLYVIAATIADYHAYSAIERGCVFAELPGGLEQPRALELTMKGYLVQVAL